METFGPAKSLEPNNRFAEWRRSAIRDLKRADIDPPIADIIASLNERDHCFTQQCCYGHFLWLPGQDPRNLERLPAHDPGTPIEYRIAYVALCLDDTAEGRTMLNDLKTVPDIDTDYVQFGSADWFWTKQANSYALQVEPMRFRRRDQAVLDFKEASYVMRVRDRFFTVLRDLFC